MRACPFDSFGYLGICTTQLSGACNCVGGTRRANRISIYPIAQKSRRARIFSSTLQFCLYSNLHLISNYIISFIFSAISIANCCSHRNSVIYQLFIWNDLSTSALAAIGSDIQITVCPIFLSKEKKNISHVYIYLSVYWLIFNWFSIHS